MRRGIAGLIAAAVIGIAGFTVVGIASANASDKPSYIQASTSEYLSTVRSLAASAGYPVQSDADYIQGGKDICAQFADGDTWADFRNFIAEYGLDYNIHRAYVWAAVRTFCPEHTALLR